MRRIILWFSSTAESLWHQYDTNEYMEHVFYLVWFNETFLVKTFGYDVSWTYTCTFM